MLEVGSDDLGKVSDAVVLDLTKFGGDGLGIGQRGTHEPEREDEGQTGAALPLLAEVEVLPGIRIGQAEVDGLVANEQPRFLQRAVLKAGRGVTCRDQQGRPLE